MLWTALYLMQLQLEAMSAMQSALDAEQLCTKQKVVPLLQWLALPISSPRRSQCFPTTALSRTDSDCLCQVMSKTKTSTLSFGNGLEFKVGDGGGGMWTRGALPKGTTRKCASSTLSPSKFCALLGVQLAKPVFSSLLPLNCSLG